MLGWITEPVSSEMDAVKSGTPTRRSTGRPRERRADRAILEAALELIAERGIHSLRMDAVAERAGVGKATIYRRHRSKEELVAAAVDAMVSEISVPDTGSTADDLLHLMREAVALYGGSIAGRVIPSLVEGMRRNPALGRAVRDRFLAGRRGALREVLERGIARGDLRADLDVELALDVLGGPLFYRLLVTGGPLDEQLAGGVVELILRGFAPTAGSRANTNRKKGTSR
jgi:AcrR family transcriptional regulator